METKIKKSQIGESIIKVSSDAPIVTDDSSKGFEVGSIWYHEVDSSTTVAYYCADATVGAAVWKQVSSSGGGSLSFDEWESATSSGTADKDMFWAGRMEYDHTGSSSSGSRRTYDIKVNGEVIQKIFLSHSGGTYGGNRVLFGNFCVPVKKGETYEVFLSDSGGSATVTANYYKMELEESSGGSITLDPNSIVITDESGNIETVPDWYRDFTSGEYGMAWGDYGIRAGEAWATGQDGIGQYYNDGDIQSFQAIVDNTIYGGVKGVVGNVRFDGDLANYFNVGENLVLASIDNDSGDQVGLSLAPGNFSNEGNIGDLEYYQRFNDNALPEVTLGVKGFINALRNSSTDSVGAQFFIDMGSVDPILEGKIMTGYNVTNPDLGTDSGIIMNPFGLSIDFGINSQGTIANWNDQSLSFEYFPDFEDENTFNGFQLTNQGLSIYDQDISYRLPNAPEFDSANNGDVMIVNKTTNTIDFAPASGSLALGSVVSGSSFSKVLVTNEDGELTEIGTSTPGITSEWGVDPIDNASYFGIETSQDTERGLRIVNAPGNFVASTLFGNDPVLGTESQFGSIDASGIFGNPMYKNAIFGSAGKYDPLDPEREVTQEGTIATLFDVQFMQLEDREAETVRGYQSSNSGDFSSLFYEDIANETAKHWGVSSDGAEYRDENVLLYRMPTSAPIANNQVLGVTDYTTGQLGFVGGGVIMASGTATLTAGEVVVSSTAVTSNSKIFAITNGGDLTNLGFMIEVKADRVNGTSFKIKSSNSLDASDIAWMIVE